MTKPETIKVVSSDPKSQGPFVVLAKSEFNPKKHKAYKPGKAAAEPKKKKGNKKNEEKSEVTHEELFASIEAIQLAEDAGLTAEDLKDVKGSGEDGKYTVEDVNQFIEDL